MCVCISKKTPFVKDEKCSSLEYKVKGLKMNNLFIWKILNLQEWSNKLINIKVIKKTIDFP